MSNTYNRMIVIASILVAILATGLLALNPSTITNAGAQMYGNQYGYDDNNNYYQGDNNRYDYPKDSKKSSHVDIQKIKCVNSNINVNGIDITQIPQDGTAALTATNEEGQDAVNLQNGNSLADRINFERNLVNICINYNQNEQIKIEPVEEPIPANLDLATANAVDNTVSILLGNGDGTFAPKKDIPMNAENEQPIFVATGLFNADNNLDLAVTDLTEEDICIFPGNGDGTFGTPADCDSAGGGDPVSIVVGLFNADQNLDVAITSRQDGEVCIKLGKGDGTFAPANCISTGMSASYVVVGLFNADSKVDLAVANTDANTVSILLGNGDGTFGPKTDFLVGNEPHSLAVGDFNPN